MPSPNLILLYAKDPAESLRFYEKLVGQAPFAQFSTYVAFGFDSGLTLGL